MKSFYLSFDKKNTERIKKFLSSIKNENAEQTYHWSKRTIGNIESVSIENNLVKVFKTDTGLSDEYESLFNKNFKKKIKLKLKIKKLILNFLKIYTNEGFFPKYPFLKNLPKNPIIKLDDINKEFGKNQNDYTIFKSAEILNNLVSIIKDYDFTDKKVIEIGPGAANLSRIIKSKFISPKFLFIDLQSSLIYSILNLIKRFPNSMYILPNEINDQNQIIDNEFDFIFLTNKQLNLVPDNYFDIGFNTMSFQEMHFDAISEYFAFLRRVLKKENLFYCLNAVEKLMKYNNLNQYIRFQEYPWSKNDHDYYFSLSRIQFGMTTKPFYEKITKLKVNL